MYKLILIAVTLFSCNCFSEDIRLSVGVGRGNIDLSSTLDLADEIVEDSPIANNFYIGFLLPQNFVIDIGLSSITNDVFFGANDNVRLESYEILVGYQFKHESFYLEPKLGYAKWNLELEEGAFFNPGAEERSEVDGNDSFAMLTAGHRFNDVFGISVSYKYLDFDYGHAESYTFGFDFIF